MAFFTGKEQAGGWVLLCIIGFPFPFLTQFEGWEEGGEGLVCWGQRGNNFRLSLHLITVWFGMKTVDRRSAIKEEKNDRIWMWSICEIQGRRKK